MAYLQKVRPSRLGECPELLLADALHTARGRSAVHSKTRHTTFEVISASSEATDQRAKLLAYTTLPTLQNYFIVRQDRMEIAHVRRTASGWEEFTLNKPDQEVEIPEVDFRLPLRTIYAAASLWPPPTFRLPAMAGA